VSWRSGDQGRISVMLAICLSGLLAVIGVAADASGQVRTVMYADSVAAEAARAAGQAIDVDHTAQTGEHRVDPLAAEQAAHAYLDAAGVTGQVSFNPDFTEITVTAEAIYQPRILSLFGLAATTVTGSHTAALVAD